MTAMVIMLATVKLMDSGEDDLDSNNDDVDYDVFPL